MANPSVTNACPDEVTLAGYVSGTLSDSAAIELSAHLDDCQRCEQAVNRLNGEDDLVAALGRTATKPGSRNPGHLDRLITDVQKLNAAPSDNKLGQRENESGAREADRNLSGEKDDLSLESFIELLGKSRLLEQDELQSLLEEIKPADTKSLVDALNSQGKLTSFQSRALLKRKWKGLVLGNYTIVDKLNRGGMGNVFKARHRHMGRMVCLKVLRASGRKSPEILERFRREAEMIEALSHPNIVVAHDSGQEDGIPFLVMELIEGDDLAKRVKQHGPFQAIEAVEIIFQAARALEYAHRQGVIHRDIKPQNIFLDQYGIAKVLDLGLARLDASEETMVASFSSNNAMTTFGSIMGTIDYLSPEQAIDSHDADARSDIYSLGCTLYFLLTGQVPFAGGSIAEKLAAHREQDIPRLDEIRSDIPLGIDVIFRKMVAKNPEDRFQSMAELIHKLELLREGSAPVTLSLNSDATSESGEFTTATYRTPTRKRSRTRGITKWIALVGAIMAALLVWKSQASNQYVAIDISNGSAAVEYPVHWLSGEPGDLHSNPKWKTNMILLRRVHSGFFNMGSAEELWRGGYYDQRTETEHQVALTRDYFIGVFEVTQRQYQLVLGKAHQQNGETLPVQRVNWRDARGGQSPTDPPSDHSFVGELSVKSGLQIDLPTEAQWEYACRAGNPHNFSFGNDSKQLHRYGNFRDRTYSKQEQNDAWWASKDRTQSDYHGGIATVGSYQPNRWGLYDMHGNVTEWCRDQYVDRMSDAATVDPVSERKEGPHVIRGGSWERGPFACRSSTRDGTHGESGFRVVMLPE